MKGSPEEGPEEFLHLTGDVDDEDDLSLVRAQVQVPAVDILVMVPKNASSVSTPRGPPISCGDAASCRCALFLFLSPYLSSLTSNPLPLPSPCLPLPPKTLVHAHSYASIALEYTHTP